MGESATKSAYSDGGVGAGIFFLTAAAVFVAVYALHLLGHAIGGWLTGLRVYQVGIGPLSWTRDGSGFRVAKSGPFCAWVAMRPKGRASTKAQNLAYLLGGPLVNVGLGVATVVWVAHHLTPWQSESGALFVAVLFVAVGALACLIPYRNGDQSSDGHRIRSITTQWEAVRRSEALDRLCQDAAKLRPPAAWSEPDLEVAGSDPTDLWAYTGALRLRFLRAVLLDDPDAATELVEKMLAATPTQSGWFLAVQLEAAFFLAFVMRDGARAEDSLNSIPAKASGGDFRYPLALAAVRLVQSRWQESIDAANEALRCMNDPDTAYKPYPQFRAMLGALHEEASRGLAGVQ